METLTITAKEAKLLPITEPRRPLPVYRGKLATKLHWDRWCECNVWYENQIMVPKRHSVVCFCPKCGCVTQD